MKRKWRETAGLTALNLFFMVLCTITLVPILYALSVSFSGSNSLLSSDFSFIPKNFTLANYAEVLLGENIAVWFRNTVFLAIVTVGLSLTVAVPAAYCFSRRRFPGRKTILRCLVLLNSFPAILSMFAIYRLMSALGLVNTHIGLQTYLVELVVLLGRHPSAFCLPAIGLDTHTYIRIYLVASSQLSRRSEEVKELCFAKSLAGTSLKLDVPMRTKFPHQLFFLALSACLSSRKCCKR